MSEELRPLTKSAFEPILKSISDLTEAAAHLNKADHDFGSEEQDEEEEDEEYTMQSWVRAGPSRIQLLLDHEQVQVARDELNEVEAELQALDEDERGTVSDALRKLETLIDERTRTVVPTDTIKNNSEDNSGNNS